VYIIYAIFPLSSSELKAAVDKASLCIDGDKVNAIGGAFNSVGYSATTITDADLITNESVGDVAAIIHDEPVSK
jgi:hypothetical protein